MKTNGAVIWLTGLSGSGKTTISNCLFELFARESIVPILLDGDEIRQGLKIEKFDEDSRRRHNLNVGQMASKFEQKGEIVIVSLISPYSDIRNKIRASCNNFIEVYVDTPLEICVQRDPKGLYKKAISGEISDFTGISAPYFPPPNPEVTVFTNIMSILECTNEILNFYSLKK